MYVQSQLIIIQQDLVLICTYCVHMYEYICCIMSVWILESLPSTHKGRIKEFQVVYLAQNS